ncbi:DUF4920 domain-containing protein [Pseudozobellia thermophila]|uniref:DUF4920 domain-containing protein n=1 Tax=Pseudozobellia thermophila TaxID=192903 RepID=A0A1M6HR35_9FLAO|nr:DUF4920 domain-containing protein [Pseudozobellia thermophila]SHJ24682.1 protein of unknown function [Pseudozobellia thermophila]
MKRFNILLVFLIVFSACSNRDNKKQANDRETLSVPYRSYGKEFSPSGVKSHTEMAQIYRDMEVADTLAVRFKATVADVCQAKGCWMKLQLGNGQETMVRFKDYGFFVPKNSTGKEVVVNGLAFVETMGVEDQRHYAMDAGQSEEEVARITAPKQIPGFEADGVLLLE